jgi:putative ubiquitin-RnfH superfamily antitoxin RatB of RatAB toxin-antitoxin module
MASESGLRVTLAYSPAARQVRFVTLELTFPCSVLQALQQSGLLEEFPEIDSTDILVGVWGRLAELRQPLRDQDRVEVYRPLRVDPKVARRERFANQGVRGAGLFAKKRAGAKAGY